MTHVEVTRQSWFARLFQSVVGVLFGIFILLAAFPLLFWNEGRAVRRARSLAEGAGAVVSVEADRVDAANEGRLVHLSGPAATSEVLQDAELGVSANALMLRRTAEMFLWKETSKSETRNRLGGGTETVTVYDYEKAWSDDLIRSSSFKEPDGHVNPTEMPVDSAIWRAGEVTLGAFTLTTEQIGNLNKSETLRLENAALDALPQELARHASVREGGFYLGGDATTPTIGDIRIRYDVVPPGPVSIVARQVGNTFEPYRAQAGSSILLVEDGTRSAATMFRQAQTENTILTWVIRAGGLLMMFISLTIILRPIRVMGDVVPMVGTLLGLGIGLVSAVLAFALSTLTVAFAWMIYRPLFGITLVVIGVAGIVWIVRLAQNQKPARIVVPPPIPAA